jgi:hypothetical protein
MKRFVNKCSISILSLAVASLGTATARAQVFGTNGPAGVYVRGNGQAMAGTFDANGFRGVMVGEDGEVRRVNSKQFPQVNPFRTQHAPFGDEAASAMATPTAIGPGGFDPFAFVFGQSAPQPGFAAAGTNSTPRSDLNVARGAFRRGQLERALQLSEQAVAADPDDTDALQVQALVSFAMGQYEQAASAAHTVLAAAAAWDWATLRQMYPDTGTYLAQLRALQEHTRQEPNSVAANFLLAYHYLILQKVDEARKELIRVKDLQPTMTLVDQMLRSLPPSLEGR